VAAVGQAMEQRTSIMDGKLKGNENARRILPCFLLLAECPPYWGFPHPPPLSHQQLNALGKKKEGSESLVWVMGRWIGGSTEKNDKATLLFFESIRGRIEIGRGFNAITTDMAERRFIISSSSGTCSWRHLSPQMLSSQR